MWKNAWFPVDLLIITRIIMIILINHMFFLDKEPPGVWKPRRKYMLTVLRQHGLGEISRPMMLIYLSLLWELTFHAYVTFLNHHVAYILMIKITTCLVRTKSFTVGNFSEWVCDSASFNRWSSKEWLPAVCGLTLQQQLNVYNWL